MLTWRVSTLVRPFILLSPLLSTLFPSTATVVKFLPRISHFDHIRVAFTRSFLLRNNVIILPFFVVIVIAYIQSIASNASPRIAVGSDCCRGSIVWLLPELLLLLLLRERARWRRNVERRY